jgi:polyisoprenoid-binding protein YceI
MSRWTFEPGHTAAEFSVRHMMVTHVRGHFKNVHGTLEFDPAAPMSSRVEAVIDARGLWSGEPDRDAHLKSADFLDVERFPEITFRGDRVRLRGADEAAVLGDLTVRGVTRPVELLVHYLGQWQTPWWEGGVDKGPKTRAGFVATTHFNRHDFGVSWNGVLDRGGVVVGDDVAVIIDAEAILQS